MYTRSPANAVKAKSYTTLQTLPIKNAKFNYFIKNVSLKPC